MFGTDYGTSSPQDGMTPDDLQGEKQDLDENYQRLWNYVATKIPWRNVGKQILD